jgi:taurine dioxygenase
MHWRKLLMTDANTIDAIEVIPSGAALGAEVRGIDFSKPIGNDIRDRIRQIWADHLVLLFRNQDLSDEALLAAAVLFGGEQSAASRDYFVRAGYKPGETDKVSRHPGISAISNLDNDGKPVRVSESLGSLELVWHSDNSYVAVPPAGTLLHARIVPVNGGGETSFNNQYLAYEELPETLKKRIEGLHICHDPLRSTTGRFRPGVEAPKSRDDIKGPVHPIVRIHPLTGKRALYLGRRHDWPSSYIVELDDAESGALLDELWRHATQDHLQWTHDWQVGDLLLYDNRCAMHRRNEVDETQPRVLHRALVKGEPVISAWSPDAAAE